MSVFRANQQTNHRTSLVLAHGWHDWPHGNNCPAVLDSTDPKSFIRYRIAYGEAARLAEMARFDHAWGRDFAARIKSQGEKTLLYCGYVSLVAMCAMNAVARSPGHFGQRVFR